MHWRNLRILRRQSRQSIGASAFVFSCEAFSEFMYKKVVVEGCACRGKKKHAPGTPFLTVMAKNERKIELKCVSVRGACSNQPSLRNRCFRVKRYWVQVQESKGYAQAFAHLKLPERAKYSSKLEPIWSANSYTKKSKSVTLYCILQLSLHCRCVASVCYGCLTLYCVGVGQDAWTAWAKPAARLISESSKSFFRRSVLFFIKTAENPLVVSVFRLDRELCQHPKSRETEHTVMALSFFSRENSAINQFTCSNQLTC